LEEFGRSFGLADRVIIADIYGSAREHQGGVSADDLVEAIKKHSHGKDVEHISGLDNIEKKLRQSIAKEDVVALLGAGDIFRVGKNLVR
jgi:UDP-N-acetylmuramate--alanine ligase